MLLQNAYPVLIHFLERELLINDGIVKFLRTQKTDRAKSREDEILEKNKEIRQILEKYFE